MTQTADIEVSRGNAKLASGILLLLVVPFLLRHRYLVLAVLFNLPGNAIIGDGGGIALIAGMSRLFPFPKYVLLVCVAITPVPLLFLLRALQQ